MKRAGRIYWMPFLLLLHLGYTAASESDRPAFDEEYAKQQKIYQTQDDNLLASYVTDRSLASYKLTLPVGFITTLSSLGQADRWMDIGAGQGCAILDYYNPNFDTRYLQRQTRRGEKAKAVAISIEDRKTLDWQVTAANLEPNQLRYLSGQSLRRYSLTELGHFQLITDVYGGLSYTRDLSLFMTKALEFLAVNGTFYTLLQDVRAEDGKNQPFYEGWPFLTEITNADGSEGKICSWLKSISCVDVTCDLKPWKPAIETYSIRKVCNDVRVPTLTPTEYSAGTPPWRSFRLQNE